MTSYSKLGAAVVGAGFIGPVHVEALRRLGVRVTGILGQDEKESSQAQALLGLPRAYRDLDEVLADTDVDAVHLAVPNVLHYDMACRVLEGGKNVLVEKPLAMDSRESADLVRRASEKEVAAGVCYNLRFYPLNLHVREIISRGEIGDVYAVNGSYVQDWLLYETDFNWRVIAEQGGPLRAIADIGTHWMDLVTSMTGLEVESLLADLRTVHELRKRPRGDVETFTGKLGTSAELEAVRIDTEDYAAVLFRFRGGARGSLHVSQVTAGRKNCLRYEISGSKCALAWNSEAPNELWTGFRERPNNSLVRDPSLLSADVRRYTSYPGGHNEGFPDTFKGCFRAFYEYIQAGNFSAKPFFPTFEEGHREILLCEAILKSHRERSWVRL